MVKSWRLKTALRHFLLGFTAIAAIFLLPSFSLSGAAFVDSAAIKSSISIVPYCEYSLDPKGTLRMEEIFSPERINTFVPLTDGLPLTSDGSVWLRFTLAPAPEIQAENNLFLDLGPGVPRGSVLYFPASNDPAQPSVWQGRKVDREGLLKLPPSGPLAPKTMFVRVPGTPGFWFNPTIKTEENASQGTAVLPLYISICLLVLTMVLCLLRAFRDGGEWRLWTAVFAALILAESLLDMPAMPSGNVPFSGLLNVILPALSLALLPHIARHLFNSRVSSKGLDSTLTLLSIIGALVPVLALVPGYSWFIKILPLWPAFAVVCAIPALFAIKHHMPGAGKYALSSILLAACSLASLLATTNVAPGSIFSAAPLWGGILFTLLLGVSSIKKENSYSAEHTARFKGGPRASALNIDDMLDTNQENLSLADRLSFSTPLSAGPDSNEQDEPLRVQNPHSDFNLGASLNTDPAPANVPEAPSQEHSTNAYSPFDYSGVYHKPEPERDIADAPVVLPFQPTDEPVSAASASFEQTAADLSTNATTPYQVTLDARLESPSGEAPSDQTTSLWTPPAQDISMPKQTSEAPLPEHPEAPNSKPSTAEDIQNPAAEQAPPTTPESFAPVAMQENPLQSPMETSSANYADSSTALPPASPESLDLKLLDLEPLDLDQEVPASTSDAPIWTPPVKTEEEMAAPAHNAAAPTGAYIPAWARSSLARKAAAETLASLNPVQHDATLDTAHATPHDASHGSDFETFAPAEGAVASQSDFSTTSAASGLSGSAFESPLPDLSSPSSAPDLADGPAPDFASGSGTGSAMGHASRPEQHTAQPGFTSGQDTPFANDDLNFAESPAQLQDDKTKVTPLTRVLSVFTRSDRTVETAYPYEHTTASASKANASSPWSQIIAKEAAQLDPTSLGKIEECLKVPLEALKNAASELSACSLPPLARTQSETIAKTSEVLSDLVNTLTNAHISEPLEMLDSNPVDKDIFDLQVILREAHNAVAAKAERRGLALSWFMPPHLPLLYKGNATQLQNVLRLLLDSAIESTMRGTVQVAVRRVPDSTDPGHLVFTVTDTGQTSTSLNRSTTALMRAWELIVAEGGALSMDSTPNQGTVISFTLRLEVPGRQMQLLRPLPAELAESLEAENGQANNENTPSIAFSRPLEILVADEQSTNRQLLAFFLGDLPYTIKEARTFKEAISLYAESPAGLIFFDSSLNDSDLASAINSVHDIDASLNIAPVSIIALVQDHADVPAALDAGCAAAMRKPLSRSKVRDCVNNLLPIPEDILQAFNEQEVLRKKREHSAKKAEGTRLAAMANQEIEETFKNSYDDSDQNLEVTSAVDELLADDEQGVHFAPLATLDIAGPGQPEQASLADPKSTNNISRSGRVMALAAAAKRFIPIKKKAHSAQSTLPPEPEFEESTVSEPRPVQRQWQETDNADLPEAPYADSNSSFDAQEDTAAPVADWNAGEPLDTQCPNPAAPDLETGLEYGLQPEQQAEQQPDLDQNGQMEPELPEPASENMPSQSAAPPATQETKRIPYEDIDPDVVYLIPGLLDSLDMALDDAYTGKEHGSFLAISEACMRLAGTADAHGLKVLKGIANCVERAAQASDMDAVDDLLAELNASVQNNRKKLEAIYTAYTSQDNY